jgi:hypothetical protein
MRICSRGTETLQAVVTFECCSRNSHFTGVKPPKTFALVSKMSIRVARSAVAAEMEFRGVETTATASPQQIEMLHAELFEKRQELTTDQ